MNPSHYQDLMPIWVFLPVRVEYLGDMIGLTEASYFQEQSTIFVVGFSQIQVMSCVLIMLLVSFNFDLEVFMLG